MLASQVGQWWCCTDSSDILKFLQPGSRRREPARVSRFEDSVSTVTVCTVFRRVDNHNVPPTPTYTTHASTHAHTHTHTHVKCLNSSLLSVSPQRPPHTLLPRQAASRLLHELGEVVGQRGADVDEESPQHRQLLGQHLHLLRQALVLVHQLLHPALRHLLLLLGLGAALAHGHVVAGALLLVLLAALGHLPALGPPFAHSARGVRHRGRGGRGRLGERAQAAARGGKPCRCSDAAVMSRAVLPPAAQLHLATHV